MLLNLVAAAIGGAGGFLLDLANNLFDGQDIDGQSVTCTLNIQLTGEITWTGADANPSESGHTWFSPINGTDGTGWSVRLGFTSGTDVYSSGEALDTWLAMTSNRAFTFVKLTAGGPDTASGVYLLEFSNDGGSTVHASVSINDITLFEQSP